MFLLLFLIRNIFRLTTWFYLNNFPIFSKHLLLHVSDSNTTKYSEESVHSKLSYWLIPLVFNIFILLTLPSFFASHMPRHHIIIALIDQVKKEGKKSYNHPSRTICTSNVSRTHLINPLLFLLLIIHHLQ